MLAMSSDARFARLIALDRFDQARERGRLVRANGPQELVDAGLAELRARRVGCLGDAVGQRQQLVPGVQVDAGGSVEAFSARPSGGPPSSDSRSIVPDARRRNGGTWPARI